MSTMVGIIGLGLLGGSMAKALRAFTDYEVIGYARRQEVCDAALLDGCVSSASTDVTDIIENSHIVVFALPPDRNAKLFTETAHLFRPGMVVTDVSSAKRNFVKAVYDAIPEGVRFVSIHPMAGSERGGFEMTTKELFRHTTWIVLDDPSKACWSEQVAQELSNMGRAFGARVIHVLLDEHDDYLASVSHMPHLMAATVAVVGGGGEDGTFRMQLAAGGFRDVTRICAGNPSMWREILRGNREAVLRELTEVETQVARLKELLVADDEGRGLEEYLRKAKAIRDTFTELMVK